MQPSASKDTGKESNMRPWTAERLCRIIMVIREVDPSEIQRREQFGRAIEAVVKHECLKSERVERERSKEE
jgi:hypothetical protein